MEEKKLSEMQATAKEWGAVTCKAFHQIDKELGVKGRIAVLFGITIVWLLGALVAHTGDRYERSFDRDGRGSMMQDRQGMMGNYRRGNDDQYQGRSFGSTQDRQGYSQQTSTENPDIHIIRAQMRMPIQTQAADVQAQQSDSVFDHMESRMKQLFGSDDQQAATPITPIGVPSTTTGIVR